MISTKVKSHTTFKVVLTSLIFLFLYTVFMIFELAANYSRLEKAYQDKKLEGKSIPEMVKIIGKPSSIEYVNPWSYDMETFEPKISDGSYFKLVYYTDKSVLNFIGWFPCGGTRIFADRDGLITGIKQYCY